MNPNYQGSSTAIPNIYGKTDLTYNDYLKVPDLLQLQVQQSSPVHHDEMLFIIIHQAYELWFKLVLHELEFAISYMQQSEVLRAHHFVKRAVEIMKLMVPQIHILETMTPIEFLEFREHLNPASGFQSLQFREIEFVAGLKDPTYLKHFVNRPEIIAQLNARLQGPDLRTGYFKLLKNLGFDIPTEDTDENREAIILGIKPIYQSPKDHLPLYLLSESLVDLDEYLSLWREHHVRVVERVIGFKRGTGGSSGAEYLRSTTSKKCFPHLWDVRTYLEKMP
ncbi:MAG: tryptophan 2,3-dioxygenase [Methylotenera sp.]|nr:tryptophan 2,3-dioxygenase [Oligoflexia bacterium]